MGRYCADSVSVALKDCKRQDRFSGQRFGDAAGMNGWEVAGEVARLRPGTPVYLVSG